VQKTCQLIANFLSKEIQEMGHFEILTNGSDIPVFAWKLKEGDTPNWNLYDLSRQLRTYGWQVPAYPLPPGMEEVTVMRIVVRNGFSTDLAHLFLMNLKQAIEYLDSVEGSLPHQTKHDNGFHH
jgi:glutamate decarboxylase